VAFQADTGQQLWSTTLSQASAILGPTVFGDSIWLTAGSAPSVQGFDTNGRFRFSTLLHYWHGSMGVPSYSLGTLYTWAEGAISGLDPIPGTKLWSYYPVYPYRDVRAETAPPSKGGGLF
jgi:outer membrane protein assembly factor BamB